jgi:acyl-CoA synthetase (AMP-forming)/AMP-acid ligase II
VTAAPEGWPPEPVAPVLDRIDQYLDHWAADRGDWDFLVDGGPTWTGRRLNWHDTRIEVDRVAAALMATGLDHGERVAYLSDPRLDFFVHFLAATSIGLVWQGLNPKYTWNEVSYVAGDFTPRVVFDGRAPNAVDDQPNNEPGDDLVGRLVAEVTGIDRTITVDSPDWEAFLAAGRTVAAAELAARRDAVRPLDPAFIVYTSGSTGRPKGAVLTHRGICWCGVTGTTARGGPDLSVICNLPVNHVGAVSDICCRKMVGGGTIVFQERFDAVAMLATIEAERIGVWGGVPTMFQLCADHPDFATRDLSSVRQVQWGGAAMPAPVLDRILDRLDVDRCVCGYGMSETTGGVTAMPPDATREQLETTVGRVIPGHEFRIADGDGNEVEPGESGEVQVRGDWIMAGYWNRPEATAEASDSDGWLHTGDLAMLRPDGHVQLVGRMSEMFKTGGYNAYPREIEMCLEEHPAVRMAAVVSVPDPVFDEVGHAFVVAEPGTDAEDLRSHCRERLANYKVPKVVNLRDELPRLAVGKVDKKALTAEAARFTRS